eukprot:8210427-Pyramimonas_sp.AAC.1
MALPDASKNCVGLIHFWGVQVAQLKGCPLRVSELNDWILAAARALIADADAASQPYVSAKKSGNFDSTIFRPSAKPARLSVA